ncbi:penicillin-binding protein 2 [Deinococcus metallilatus]|uniref:Cell division protein FtsI (Penicillin-binding protein 3) n=2 Tax=Deinococcus TaxID=1298 RepID=A0AAJ5F239_9DEIO|nr:penicillin-binding protein 2 [Deinococcus metallilatus]MBB5295253.1 cell division protein FtsI (penicillin-binding protein 3) [Deinococcus metallilatus]QBY08586.1 penicillin-binding protein 2 [Deinococcus metallilatus]RXJ10848.1 penicillin-binding protein 2 [Deinococcus metallilatus]TLK22183.1 penicillin-binding protein 2 [Deinococcus metallilatus]GMA15027.1 penicillin-binding protein 2 [Deinococcus metallilatus]
MEVKIHHRSRLMQVIALLLFLTLVWAYAQLEWGVPQGVKRTVVQARGSIVAADGTVLARSVNGKRVYPQGQLAGQVLGMMGATDGLEGLEYAYNHALEGGKNLKLTLDPGVQAAAEAALAKAVPKHLGEYGSVVVLETRTGRILAAASYPPFDPNNWRTYSPETRRNRPFLDVFEPGSTIKGLVVAAALNEGLTTPETVYSTPMRRYVGGRWGSTIGDAVPHPGSLTTQMVLRYSSNVGMSHIVEHFAPERMRGYLSQYGFGTDVAIPTVMAATGRLQPLRQWDDLVRATNAFGQGMSSTTLQLAAAYNSLANDGLYVSPRLVEGEPAGERRDVLRPETARTTRRMLQFVIEEGIPHQAGIKGYALAGKTGTAQVAGEHGYASNLYDSVFAGFFPADAPRITVAVMVHGAKIEYHGSQLAAPIYREVASEILSRWAAAPREEEQPQEKK